MATPTSDPYLGVKPDLDDGAVYVGAFAITAGTPYPFTPRAIYIGGNGNLVCTGADGNSVTFTGLVIGTILPFRPVTITASGTTATNLLGLY